MIHDSDPAAWPGAARSKTAVASCARSTSTPTLRLGANQPTKLPVPATPASSSPDGHMLGGAKVNGSRSTDTLRPGGAAILARPKSGSALGGLHAARSLHRPLTPEAHASARHLPAASSPSEQTHAGLASTTGAKPPRLALRSESTENGSASAKGSPAATLGEQPMRAPKPIPRAAVRVLPSMQRQPSFSSLSSPLQPADHAHAGPVRSRSMRPATALTFKEVRHRTTHRGQKSARRCQTPLRLRATPHRCTDSHRRLLTVSHVGDAWQVTFKEALSTTGSVAVRTYKVARYKGKDVAWHLVPRRA